MARFFAKLSYNGMNYVGWQFQPNGISVQQTLKESLSIILRDDVEIVGAGRTDAGVHALNMVAHFDWNGNPFIAEDLVYKINNFLPKDISIISIRKVIPDAHARFDAVSRTYRYYITTRKNPFLHEFTYKLNYVPDIDKMNELSAELLNFSDFTSFSKSHTDVKTNNCKISFAKWEKKDDLYVFTITADRFLRNMIRAIVGTLLEGGRGRLDTRGIRRIIEAKNRQTAGDSVPGHALFLEEIIYPDNIWI